MEEKRALDRHNEKPPPKSCSVCFCYIAQCVGGFALVTVYTRDLMICLTSIVMSHIFNHERVLFAWLFVCLFLCLPVYLMFACSCFWFCFVLCFVLCCVLCFVCVFCQFAPLPLCAWVYGWMGGHGFCYRLQQTWGKNYTSFWILRLITENCTPQSSSIKPSSFWKTLHFLRFAWLQGMFNTRMKMTSRLVVLMHSPSLWRPWSTAV